MPNRGFNSDHLLEREFRVLWKPTLTVLALFFPVAVAEAINALRSSRLEKVDCVPDSANGSLDNDLRLPRLD